ncbi:MAG: MtnX-like HAD-IB family phosphatase [Elusimicrobiota bacterium]|jgi:2,3-diketo-5-methylthio-1-phosphopentane phosphatase|nr:MtnX-like HAD-IB family phosphatase [Elusimicrobiota bacterium]
MKKIAFVSDFDGTITKKDFFQMAADELLDKTAMAPWYDYKAGRITHVEALSKIFAQIHIPQAQMDAFIASIEVDTFFHKTMAFCSKVKMPVYICSAGTEYYINKRIAKEVKEYNITLLSNGGDYSPKSGLILTPPPPTSPFYNKDTGISKEALVAKLQKDGYYTVYAGDGPPDIKAAKIANAVFARRTLLKMCQEANIKTLKFDSFKDILDYFRGIYGQE